MRTRHKKVKKKMSLLQGLKGKQGLRIKKSYQGGGYVNPQYSQAPPPPQTFTPGKQLTRVEQAGMGGYDEAIAGSGTNKAAEGISDAIPMAKMFKGIGQAGENLIVGDSTGEERKKKQKTSAMIFAPHKLLAMRKADKEAGKDFKLFGEDGMRVPVRLLKKGGRVRKNKESEGIEPMFDPSIFSSDPYSKSSISRSAVDKMYDSGLDEGYVPGLESKLTFNPSSEQYTRTQVESSPAGDPLLGFGRGGRVYENGGEVEPLTNKEFRENEKFQRQADKQRRPYERSRDVEKLLGKLENNEKVDERAQILRQLVRILGIAGTGILGTTLAGDKLGVGERGWQRIGIGGDPI
jgi:hypothetical protein